MEKSSNFVFSFVFSGLRLCFPCVRIIHSLSFPGIRKSSSSSRRGAPSTGRNWWSCRAARWTPTQSTRETARSCFYALPFDFCKNGKFIRIFAGKKSVIFFEIWIFLYWIRLIDWLIWRFGLDPIDWLIDWDRIGSDWLIDWLIWIGFDWSIDWLIDLEIWIGFDWFFGVPSVWFFFLLAPQIPDYQRADWLAGVRGGRADKPGNAIGNNWICLHHNQEQTARNFAKELGVVAAPMGQNIGEPKLYVFVWWPAMLPLSIGFRIPWSMNCLFTYQSPIRLTYWLIDLVESRCSSRLIDWLIDWLKGYRCFCLFVCSIDWLIDWSIQWRISDTVDWLIDSVAYVLQCRCRRSDGPALLEHGDGTRDSSDWSGEFSQTIFSQICFSGKFFFRNKKYFCF